MNRGHENFAWTDERISELKRLWGEGKTSGQIAALWGVTRNTICGKVNRICGKHVAPAKPKAAAAPKQKPRPTVAPVHLRLEDVRDIPEPIVAAPQRLPALPAVGILDVTGCKWPLHVDRSIIGGHAFCNAAKDERGPYCHFHMTNAGEKYRMWTDAEDQAIRQQWKRGQGRDGLAFTLKRTKHMISIRARQLGVAS